LEANSHHTIGFEFIIDHSLENKNFYFYLFAFLREEIKKHHLFSFLFYTLNILKILLLKKSFEIKKE